MVRSVIIATVTVDFREVTDSCPEPELNMEMNQAPPSLVNFQGKPSSNHPPRDMDHPSSSREQTLGGDTTRKDKGIHVEDREPQDTAGGRQSVETGSEEYGWCPIMEEKPPS